MYLSIVVVNYLKKWYIRNKDEKQKLYLFIFSHSIHIGSYYIIIIWAYINWYVNIR